MAKKKTTPDAPVTSNPFKAPLKVLKQELDAEAARRAADAKTPKPAPKPVTPVTKAVTDVWRPNLEAELFAVAMAGVQPLTATGAPRVSARDPSVPARERPPAAIKARRAQAEGGETLRAEVTPEGVVTCAHPGKTFAVEALRRFATPDDALDLHGLNEPEALVRVQEFVRTRRARGLRCVQIVHGRGKRSPGNDAVLRDVAVRALSEPPTCRELDAFVSAPDHLGGVGALLVSLRG